MKRLLALILVMGMFMALAACAGEQGNAEPTYDLNLHTETFSVGYSRIDISPNCSVPLAGYGATEKRMSQGIMDYLYATSVAISDGQGGAAVFLHMDLQRASDVLVQALRPKLAELTGLPESAFQITATHTHSGPDVQSKSIAISPYVEMLIPKLIQVIMESLEDLKPATMSIGRIEAENLNFVRHYYHLNEDGQKVYFGDNHGTAVIDSTTAHVSDPDETMFVVKFDREDAKDVCMVNWRAHPHWTGSSTKYDVSSDYVGPFREAFELQTDCLFAYYQGAAGNVNEKSKITAENVIADHREHGALLAAVAVRCLNENMEQVQTGPIRIQEKTLSLPVNTVKDTGLYYAARAVQSIFQSTGNRTEAMAASGGYPIWSVYHAGSIVNRYGKPDTEDRTYTVVTIGNRVAISLAPHEMFDRTMVRVEEGSQFDYTLHFSYANGTNTYMPDASTWVYGSYETDTSIFAQGATEMVEQNFIQMLGQMYDEAN